MKFFLSYCRDGVFPPALAAFLARGLRAAGHDVFLDVEMALGMDWVKQIEEQIRSCDCFVALLSEDTLSSEMAQTEIRLAHHRRHRVGAPVILPVRVRYEGALDYEIESYLGRLQFATWESEEDSPRLLADLLEAARSGSAGAGPGPAESAGPPPLAAPADPRRPRPAVDPWASSAPGGTLRRIDDPFYVERGADLVMARRAALSGETIVVKAPRQMGKSSLLLRYLAACQAAGKRIALLDFSSFTEGEMEDYPTVLSDVAAALLRGLRVAGPRPHLARQRELTEFVEDAVLAAVPDRLVFAFDEVDRVMGTPYQRDFFALLRQWHNSRALTEWARVDLALVISTEPYLLIDAGDRSPFNVTPAVELAPFTAGQCADLNQRYGTPLSRSEVGRLREVFNGHPFLTRLAFYCLAGPDRVDLAGLLERAWEGREPFGDHLRALLFKLGRKPDLLAALRQVIARGSAPGEDDGRPRRRAGLLRGLAAALRQAVQGDSGLGDDAYYRLYGAGLVRKVGGRIEPANPVYARFFGKVL